MRLGGSLKARFTAINQFTDEIIIMRFRDAQASHFARAAASPDQNR